MDIRKVIHLNDDYFIERSDGHITVYHPVLNTSVHLDETGALVWELCNDRRTVADIISILCRIYPENVAQIEADVKEVVINLVENKIVSLK